jgi:hypothetical protein
MQICFHTLKILTIHVISEIDQHYQLYWALLFIGKTKMKERFIVLSLLVRQDWFRNLKFSRITNNTNQCLIIE